LGLRIRTLRLERGLTQEQVAGGRISLRAYQKIERGTTSARVESLFLIAAALDVHPRELFMIQVTITPSKNSSKEIKK
jgi:transcriptional regulator with XRE-family HTH domain